MLISKTFICESRYFHKQLLRQVDFCTEPWETLGRVGLGLYLRVEKRSRPTVFHEQKSGDGYKQFHDNYNPHNTLLKG